MNQISFGEDISSLSAAEERGGRGAEEKEEVEGRNWAEGKN